MAQRQVRGMTDAQINQAVTAQLTDAGYSTQQAATLLRLANTMARGRDVGVPPAWMNGGDLDRVSKAIYDSRNDRENARSTLSRLTVTGPNMTQAQMRQEMHARVVERGYTAEQATQMVNMAAALIRGQSVTVPPQFDVNVVNEVKTILANAINEPERARQIIATSPVRAPRPQMTMRTVPTPVREYRFTYDVTVDGQRYTLEANRDLRRSEVITNATQTRGARLLAFLDGAQDADIRITREGSGSSRPVAVTRQQLMTAMRPAYRAILREFADAERRGTAPDEDIINRINLEHRQTRRG